jgi:hypothetical protein
MIRGENMKIIEIKTLENGAHRNQSGNFTAIPEGYAIIPDDMPIPDTFPFVNIEVAEETRYNEVKHYNEEIEDYEVEKIPYTVTVVTSMTAGIVPEPVPEPEVTESEELTAQEMASAILEGVSEI